MSESLSVTWVVEIGRVAEFGTLIAEEARNENGRLVSLIYRGASSDVTAKENVNIKFNAQEMAQTLNSMHGRRVAMELGGGVISSKTMSVIPTTKR